jgi:hypothetical protein
VQSTICRSYRQLKPNGAVMTARDDMLEYASNLLNGNAIWLAENGKRTQAANLMRILRALDTVSDDAVADLNSAFEDAMECTKDLGEAVNETLSSLLTQLHLEEIRPDMSATDYIRELVGIHYAAGTLASMDDDEPVFN